MLGKLITKDYLIDGLKEGKFWERNIVLAGHLGHMACVGKNIFIGLEVCFWKGRIHPLKFSALSIKLILD